jgi:hypothetical protein
MITLEAKLRLELIAAGKVVKDDQPLADLLPESIYDTD